MDLFIQLAAKSSVLGWCSHAFKCGNKLTCRHPWTSGNPQLVRRREADGVQPHGEEGKSFHDRPGDCCVGSSCTSFCVAHAFLASSLIIRAKVEKSCRDMRASQRRFSGCHPALIARRPRHDAVARTVLALRSRKRRCQCNSAFPGWQSEAKGLLGESCVMLAIICHSHADCVRVTGFKKSTNNCVPHCRYSFFSSLISFPNSPSTYKQATSMLLSNGGLSLSAKQGRSLQ